jgi:hypothetical protein
MGSLLAGMLGQVPVGEVSSLPVHHSQLILSCGKAGEAGEASNEATLDEVRDLVMEHVNKKANS